MRFKWIAAIALSILSSAAFGQGAQFPAGTVWGNDTASQRPGKAATVSSILDRALGSTRGAILERGASGWAIVGPSATAGLAWVSSGTGADPAYGVVALAGGGCNAALVASNGGILYSTASACAVLAGTATARLPLLSGASTTPLWGAFTLPASVTSGGVLCFTSTTVSASSGALSANAIVLGGGAGVCPSPMGSLGTTTTVLHGNAGGAPTFAAVANADMATMPDGTIKSNISGGTAVPADNTISSVLDKLLGTTRGSVIYRGASGWASLVPGASGTFFKSNGAGADPSYAAAASGTVLSGYLSGLTLSNDSVDITNDIDIAVGVAASDDSSIYIQLASPLVKRTDAAFAAGSNQGCGDTGAMVNGTVHFFLIDISSAPAPDILCSASLTPTLPGSYNVKRRILSISRISGAMQLFRQSGDFFKIATAADYNSTSVVTDVLTALPSLPSGIQVVPLLAFSLQQGTAGQGIILVGDGENSTADTSVARTAAADEYSLASNSAFVTNTAKQIRFSLVNGAGTISDCRIFTQGWIDSRNR